MGYDVHIIRAADWFDSESAPISLKEWLAFVEAKSEFRHDGFAVATVDGEAVLRVESEGLAVWTAYSKHDEDGNKAWFTHTNGRIVVKNPDDEILLCMKTVAAALDAIVQGDEGEGY